MRYVTLTAIAILLGLSFIFIPRQSAASKAEPGIGLRPAFSSAGPASGRESSTAVVPLNPSNAASGPALGNYPNATVNLSGDTTVTPDSPPSSATSINVSSSTNFKGMFTADPVTGVVRVTNAYPAGSYTVTVRAFNGSDSVTTTFTLTVQPGVACVGASTFFANFIDSGVGSHAGQVAIGDFNNDGKEDIATANYKSTTVSIGLGDGAGSFSRKADVNLGTLSLAIGDFNSDGKQDIAAAHGDAVAIQLGDGLGGFTGATEVILGKVGPWAQHPSSVVIGDFNNDGKQDFATANLTESTVSIRLGDGLGGFSGTTDLSMGHRPTSLAIGDFNNDGRQDIAITKQDSTTVSIRFGDGLGGFSGTTEVSVGANSNWPEVSIAIGDFNNDGNQDIAAAGYTMLALPRVSIRLGDGLGGFTGTTEVIVGADGDDMYSVTIGDFNNDGNQDIATYVLYSSSGLPRVSIRFGDGLGGFSGTTDLSMGPRTDWEYGIPLAVGDFNNDGKQDIAVASNTALILGGTCDAALTIAPATALSRQRGGPARNSQIAAVTDGGGAGNVSVTVASANPSNGVTISNIVKTDGNITADIVASCGASDATFILRASDGSWLATTSLTVKVTANTLSYSNSAVGFNGALTVVPTPLIDITTITSYAVQSVVPPLTTAPTVDANGVVSITNAQPEGLHVITIRMTDCGTTTEGQFTLEVSAVPGVTCLTSIVTTNANDGGGSLRQAILQACNGATITFDMSQVFSPITLSSGELFIDKNLTIKGPGANLLTVRFGGGKDQGIFRVTGGTVSISGLTIADGTTGDAHAFGVIPRGGGGILNAGTLTISDTTIRNNGFSWQRCFSGGGIYNTSTGIMTVIKSRIVGNSAGCSGGGGILNYGTMTIMSSTIDGNVTADGGDASGQIGDSAGPGAGISNNGTLTIIASTISNNRTGRGGDFTLAGGHGGEGGGIYNTGTLFLNNSSISGNSTGRGGNRVSTGHCGVGRCSGASGAYGAGICNLGTLHITNSTISGNHTGTGGTSLLNTPNAPGGSGGGLYTSGVASMNNTIVSGNFVASGGNGPDTNGTVDPASSFNLIGTSDSGGLVDGVNHNQVGVANPNLGPLANNGGPTMTHALLPGSPAINAASNDFITNPPFSGPPFTDQRGDGFARILDTTVDIGAYESRGGFTFSATSGSSQSTLISTSFAAPLVTTVSSAFGEPVAGAMVTFTVPASGASGTFPGNVTTTTVTTNASGVATSPTFTANGLGGPYNVVASIGTTLPSVSFALTNLKSSQTINFGALTNKTFGDSDFTVSATASSGLPVSFAASGQCTIAVNTVHITGPGACTITASQVGDSNFNAAADVTQSFTIASGALISFSQSNYTVNESDEYLTVTVRRTGDLTVPVTVDYATDDTGAPITCEPVSGNKLASARCDFGLTLGTLTFAANETQRTFEVPITQDSYDGGPEMFTVNLSNPTGANVALGTPSSAVVTIYDSTAAAPNAIDDTDAFVCMQYHDFLNREPDPAGLAFWTDNIEKCNDPTRRPAGLTVDQCTDEMRISTSAAFFLSIEFQATGNLVRSFYVAALDRPLTNNMPGFVEFERDTQAMQRGVMVGQDGWQQKLDDNRDAFMRDFVTRAEFVGLYPLTDAPWQYVNKLYLHAGIIPGPGDRDAAIAEFRGASTAADAEARGRALLDVTQHPAFQDREINRSFVQMEYFGYLRRNPNDQPDSDCTGYDFWSRKLNAAGGNYIDAEMVRSFLSSSEYRRRFGP